MFPDPDRLDITRKPNRQIAFITGIHVCLGASLARVEGKIALGKLVKRFPKIEANGPAERMPLARFRGYSSLPVRV
jgi:cytochrome P450